MLKSQLQFLVLLDGSFKTNGALLPVLHFRNALQVLYSKTKFGVDGAAQIRAILRASTPAMLWEENFVFKTYKTILTNSLLSYGFLCVFLYSKRITYSLREIRLKKNMFESFPTFSHVICTEMVAPASTMKRGWAPLLASAEWFLGHK